MDFQNARYCNGFPTLRRNSDTLGTSISSTVSDIFSLFPYFPVTKMVTVVWREHYLNEAAIGTASSSFLLLSLLARTSKKA